MDFFDRDVQVGGTRGHVRSLYNWTVTNSLLISYSDINTSDDRWLTRLVACSFESASPCQALASPTLERADLILYILGNPYLAASGEVAFFFDLRAAKIYRAQPTGDGSMGSTLLSDLSAEQFLLPHLGTQSTLHDAVGVYREVEAAKMPIGLYAWDGKVYTLIRSPGAKGGTVWTLIKLDATSGRELARIDLDSQAPHLVVVPGDSWWAFVEKGSVKALGDQPITGILFVDSSQIRDL